MTGATELTSLIDDVMTSHPEEPSSGVVPDVWTTLVKLGLVDIGIAEAAGGSGGTLSDAVALTCALAGHGISAPLIEANVANWVLAGSGQSFRGLNTITVTTAPIHEADGRLLASLHRVPWARSASALVVLGHDGGGWVVDLDSPTAAIDYGANVAGEPRDTVHLNHTPARALDFPPTPVLVRARLAVLWSGAIYGAASRAYELTRRYVKDREQFGQALVQIAAVANSLAIMRVHVLQTRVGIDRAVESWQTPAAARCANAAAVARIISATAATEIARLAHQLHGAMGITQEYPLHRLTRRLWAWRDAECAEHEWALSLGAAVMAGEEPTLWDEICA